MIYEIGLSGKTGLQKRGKMNEPTEEFLEMLAKSASHQLAIDRIAELEEVVRELEARVERLERIHKKVEKNAKET